MKLYILFGQRFENYDGEYAPEALVCWDEFTKDENPEGFESECYEQIHQYGKYYSATRIIAIDINQSELRNLLLKTLEIPSIKGIPSETI